MSLRPYNYVQCLYFPVEQISSIMHAPIGQSACLDIGAHSAMQKEGHKLGYITSKYVRCL